MNLSSADKALFLERGILLLPRTLQKSEVAAVKRVVLSELDRLKLRSNGKLAARRLQSLPLFQQTGRLAQVVEMGSALEHLFSETLLKSMKLFLSAPHAKAPRPQPQLLLSFPHKEEWSLGGLNWHLDLAPSKKDEVTGVQAFVLIDDVQPRGGATLALAGSHRLHYTPSARQGGIHGLLRQDAVLSGLFSGSHSSTEALLRPRTLDGVEVSIVEMSGRAGDVYFMDMRVLHSPSINSTKNIRMMATIRLLNISA
jgi:hypothetical protein